MQYGCQKTHNFNDNFKFIEKVFKKCIKKKLLAETRQKYILVSPAYGFIALALVKCSNEGGPGPRYNMKEDPESSVFSMLVVYGYYLYLLPLFSEPGDWKDQCGLWIPIYNYLYQKFIYVSI
jgi:hypothetical protein